MMAGKDPESVRQLSRLILEIRMDAFGLALISNPPADTQPFWIKLKPDASMKLVNTRPQQLFSA